MLLNLSSKITGPLSRGNLFSSLALKNKIRMMKKMVVDLQVTVKQKKIVTSFYLIFSLIFSLAFHVTYLSKRIQSRIEVVHSVTFSTVDTQSDAFGNSLLVFVLSSAGLFIVPHAPVAVVDTDVVVVVVAVVWRWWRFSWCEVERVVVTVGEMMTLHDVFHKCVYFSLFVFYFYSFLVFSLFFLHRFLGAKS